MLRLCLAATVLIVMVIQTSPILPAQADPPFDATLLTTQPGTLPVILSAPHAGTRSIRECPDRKGLNVLQFVTVIDTRADLVATKVVAALQKKIKTKPYLVVAHFLRKQVDANRPASGAYESPIAKPYYDAYHKALKEYRDTIQKNWGRGLLLDIHGQAADSATIFRGTNNGKTVRHLLDRFGREALTGPNGILGHLEANGCKISPAGAKNLEAEDRRFTGGYIVATYGSKDAGSVDAIQLELGGSLRTLKGSDEFADKLADAIIAFSKEFLPAQPIPPKP
jgi:N-formylglutamate amidohydrolase